MLSPEEDRQPRPVSAHGHLPYAPVQRIETVLFSSLGVLGRSIGRRTLKVKYAEVSRIKPFHDIRERHAGMAPTTFLFRIFFFSKKQCTHYLANEHGARKSIVFSKQFEPVGVNSWTDSLGPIVS